MAVALKEKTLEAFEFIKENGGRVTTTELAEGLGTNLRSVTGRVNSLCSNGLAVREKVDIDGEDKPVTYVQLTDEGFAFEQPEDAE